MGSRYVRPETTLLHISQGDTLTVKKRLTHCVCACTNAAMLSGV